MTGLHLSHYAVEAELGRGGMGVVFLATDTKLNRKVALKVLPAAALASEEDRARFFREAQAAASMSHPNVCHVYQVDEAVPLTPDGKPVEGQTEKRLFIAMEYIEGETLHDYVRKGPLKLSEAVTIAGQIAEALKEAHAKDIVHRDIKSANVMLTSQGVAKVLDFGLAKTNQSTMLTRMGSTLGTVAYMSPEQARGEEVDGRSDLYSLGTVLYEMIAGRLPFAGDYEQAILYGILNEPPEPLTTIRTGVPMELERIVGKLLAKDAARRYQSTDDLLVDLRGIDLAHGGSSRSRMDAAAVKSRAKSSADGWRRLLAGVLVGASIVGLVWMFWPSQPARVQAPTLRLTHLLGSSEVPTFMNLSADGTKLAYGTDRVYVADLTTGEERPIQGSENALGVEFSADGKELLMTMSVSVDRLSIDGGTALTVLRTTEGNPRAIWGPDDWIIYEDKQQIFKYSESRGERVQISRRDSLAGENDFDWPSLLPDGRTVMATLEITDRPRRLRFMDLESGVIKATIDFSAYRVHYLPSGHLVGFVSGEGVVVVPFDLDRLELTGPRRSVANVSFVNLYTVSRNGTLVYSESGPKVDTGAVSSIPAILTFPEFREPLPIPRGYYSEFRLSPDQTELAFIRRGGSGGTGDQRSLWVLNFESGGLRQLVGYSAVNYPAWTAGGDSIAYLDAAMTGLATSVMVRAADGTGRERRLSIGRSENRYLDITSDGSRLAYVARASDTAGILRIQDVRTGERTTVERTAQNNVIKDPRFSPDGDWVAFQQDDEVIVEALDGSGTSLNMSTGVREYPRWTRDGRFVLYVSNQGFVRRLKVPYAGGSVSGAEVALLGPVVPYFEVYGDGERAIVADQIETQAQADTTASAGAAVHVLVNWLSELENH